MAATLQGQWGGGWSLVRDFGDSRRPLSFHAILPESGMHSKEAVAYSQLRPPATDRMAIRDLCEFRPGRHAALIDHDGTARMKRASARWRERARDLALDLVGRHAGRRKRIR